jgi:F0F1-type ATP synthase assembly protein I
LLAFWPSIIQLSLTVFLSVTAYVVFDDVIAKSVFLGGLAVVIPYLYFAARMKPVLGNSDSGSFLRAIAIAEVGKLILTAVCCTVVFVWVKPLNGLSFFACMTLVYLIGHMSLIFVTKDTS